MKSYMKPLLGVMLGVMALAASARPLMAADSPYWLAAMKKVNEGFGGTPRYVAQFGDSITYAGGFWKPLGWMNAEQFLKDDDGFPKAPTDETGQTKRWRDVLKGMTAKGPEHANFSGWTVEKLLEAVPVVLKRDNPEVALIMIGTNDTRPNGPPDSYGPNLEKLLTMIMEAKCIPVLNTIPPKRNCMLGVEKTNIIIRDLATKLNVPLVDYYADILKRQPDNAWDGTLLSKDGVHPSSGETGVFTDENLKISGYALRTWLNFLVVREIHFRILAAPR
jgi:lysophospholipase L1-like esterase